MASQPDTKRCRRAISIRAMSLDPSCKFCQIVAADDPKVLVYRSEHVAGFLDARPVFPGHCLLVPRAHYETLDQLPLELAEPLVAATQIAIRALHAAVGAQGTF